MQYNIIQNKHDSSNFLIIMILIKDEKLQEALRSFYTLTKVRIAVLDEWCNEIAAYPQEICALCKDLRKDAAVDSECRKSDAEALRRARQTKRQYTYRCHMGLYESIYPITAENRCIGFLMIGQFIEEKDLEQLQAALYGRYGASGLWAGELRQLTVLDKTAVSSIAYIMGICAEYLCFSKVISARNPGTAEKIEKYVEEHLSERICVQTLASRFGLSRTSLYLLTQKYFGKGVTEFINFKKIEAAKRMIAAGVSADRIAEQIGVADANYFRRMFRKYAGMPLREYKKTLISPPAQDG